METSIPAAQHHLGVGTAGELPHEVPVGGPVNIETYPDGHIPCCIDSFTFNREQVPETGPVEAGCIDVQDVDKDLGPHLVEFLTKRVKFSYQLPLFLSKVHSH